MQPHPHIQTQLLYTYMYKLNLDEITPSIQNIIRVNSCSSNTMYPIILP